MSLLPLLSCTSKADKKYGPLKTIETKVDIPKFMGTWYVIANIPTFLEVGAHNAVETYTWNEKENRIDIGFTFNQDSFDGKVKSIPQKGWIYNKSTNAEWRVQPFWPLKFAYLIIDLAPDYSYTVISVPNRSYIWIMARTPTMDETLYKKIIEKAQNQWGFDISKIEKIPHKLP